MKKEREFKRGDVIVSGYGNIRIFTGECSSGDVYMCLAPYAESDAPAGTDMRYARPATTKERKQFFDILKANRLAYDPQECAITPLEGFEPTKVLNATTKRYTGNPMPYRVIKKRIRPSLAQVRKLEAEVERLKGLTDEGLRKKLEEQIEGTSMIQKDCDIWRKNYRSLVEEKASLEKRYAILGENYKELEEKYDQQNEEIGKLKSEVSTLEQSNRSMDEELKRRNGKDDKELKKWKEKAIANETEVMRLRDRNIIERIFNL